jgi:hypothetical protein
MRRLLVRGEEAGRLERLRDAVAIGSAEFAQRVRAWGAEAPLDGVAGKRELYRRIPVAEVRRVVEEAKGEPWARFAERYGDWGCALFLWGVRRVCGLTLREAGQAAGGLAAAAVYKAVQRLSAQAARNPTLPEAQQRILKLSKVQP